METKLINFIKKANLKHNNKYNYSLVDYINNKNKVKIICPIHDVFEQSPNDHLTGNGCSLCGNKNLNKEFFIKKAKLKHGDRYDYSLVEYINNKTKVKIICPLHGVFEQAPKLLNNQEVVMHLDRHKAANAALQKILTGRDLKFVSGINAANHSLGFIWNYFHINPLVLIPIYVLDKKHLLCVLVRRIILLGQNGIS
jgi:hypothetical protein